MLLVSMFFHHQSNVKCFSKQSTMANNNAELKAFTGVHNETLNGGAHHVAHEQRDLALKSGQLTMSKACVVSWFKCPGDSKMPTTRAKLSE